MVFETIGKLVWKLVSYGARIAAILCAAFWHLTKKMHITISFFPATCISKMFLVWSKYFKIICRFHLVCLLSSLSYNIRCTPWLSSVQLFTQIRKSSCHCHSSSSIALTGIHTCKITSVTNLSSNSVPVRINAAFCSAVSLLTTYCC